jgi:hypothetical protein
VSESYPWIQVDARHPALRHQEVQLLQRELRQRHHREQRRDAGVSIDFASRVESSPFFFLFLHIARQSIRGLNKKIESTKFYFDDD